MGMEYIEDEKSSGWGWNPFMWFFYMVVLAFFIVVWLVLSVRFLSVRKADLTMRGILG
jgi:hypothetical protein